MKRGFIILAILFLLFLNFENVDAQLADSPWPVFHGNSQLTGQSQYDTSKIDGTIKWKFKAEGQSETSPVIDEDGNIYFVDHKCYLYSVKPDGTLRWKFKAGEPVTSKEWGGESCSQSSPTIGSDGVIYFLPMSGNFYAVNYDGTEKWKYKIFTFKNSWPTPMIGQDGTIYVGSESYPPTETGKPQESPAYFYALNPDGTERWKFDCGSVWFTNTPSIANDGTIYFSGNDCEKNNCANTVFAFTADGREKWRFVPIEGILEGSIAIGSDGTLYFPAKGERDPRKANFYALTPEGKEKWKVSIQNGASLTPGFSPDGKTVYFGDWGGIFYAFDTNGNKLWQIDTPGGKGTFESLSSSPAIGKEGTIFFGTIANYFFAYNPDGSMKWKIDVGGGGVDSSPAIGRDGTVYFTTVEGELYALGEGTGNETLEESSFNNKNTFALIPAIIGILIILTSIILLIAKKNKIVVLALFILGIILIGLSALFYFDHPENIIKNQDDSIYPNASGSSDCPSRIYGADGSYYGIFGMNQRDLTTEEYEKYQTECADTIFPEELYKGYQGG